MSYQTLGKSMKINLVSNNTAISTAVIAIVAIVVVAAVAGGIYFATTQNASQSPTESPTPSAPVSTPSTSTTPAETQSSTPTTSASPATSVADASSLQYSVDISQDTAGALRGTYIYYGKNLGTSSTMMRIEFNDPLNPGLSTIIIVNGALQQAWYYSDGKWTDTSSSYTTYYNTQNQVWQGYMAYLAGWNGVGDYSYTVGAATTRIYDISVNPMLSDSLFQHS
jgi:hypothetical protein